MAMAIYSSKTSPYGPYYRWSQRAMQGQRIAMGQQPLSSGEIAAERYSEVAANIPREAQARADTRAARELSLREKEAKSKEAGAKITGMATAGYMGAKLGTALFPAAAIPAAVAPLAPITATTGVLGATAGAVTLPGTAAATTGIMATVGAAVPIVGAIALLATIFGGGDK